MNVKASMRSVRISPQKIRLVARQLHNLSVEMALDKLHFSELKASRIMHKLLMSAIANAENNFSMDIDELFISEVYVDEGPIIKRQRARAKGRSTRINKRSSHVVIQVSERLEQE